MYKASTVRRTSPFLLSTIEVVERSRKRRGQRRRTRTWVGVEFSGRGRKFGAGETEGGKTEFGRESEIILAIKAIIIIIIIVVE